MNATTSLRDSFRYVGVALLVTALFIVFAVLAIAMRPLLIIAVVAAMLVSLVAYRFSPRFREWFESVGEPLISYKGLHLATDVAVHPRHSWARVSGKKAMVGVDELVESTLGPVQAVDFPSVGIHVNQGETLFKLRRGDRYVAVQAPLSGRVIATNGDLGEHPELVNEDPFSRGWVVRLQADRLREERASLMKGRKAGEWFRREIDRLLMLVSSHETLAPTLPDGGTLVDDVYQEIDDGRWQKLTAKFFGMKATA